MKLKYGHEIDFFPWMESYDQPRQHIKKQRHYFVYKGPSSQSYGFSNSHVWMWEMDHKESWAPKNWCFWTTVLENTLESPLDCKEIKTANPKGNQPWIFIEKPHAKAPILGPSDVKTWLIRKDLMLGKIEGRRRRGRQRMRWLDGITDTMDMSLSRTGDKQGSLVCCSPWGHKVLDMIEQLNWTKL